MARTFNLVAQGSSTTDGALGEVSYCDHYALAHPEITYNNLARGGKKYITDPEDPTNIGITDQAAIVDALLIEDAINVLSVQYGSNDGISSLDHPALLALPGYLKARRLAGWIVGLVTQLPRDTPLFNTRRNLYMNPTFRNQVALGNADFIVDWAADPVIGIDAAGSDTDIIGDGTHPSAETHAYGNTAWFAPQMALLTRPRYLLNW